MKNQYNKVKRLAEQIRLESAKLDKLIDERFKFNYSETDDDRMIDTLDYGTDCLDYNGFIKKMEGYKKNYEQTGKFGIVD